MLIFQSISSNEYPHLKVPFQKTKRFQEYNSLESDQTQHFVGSDLAANCSRQLYDFVTKVAISRQRYKRVIIISLLYFMFWLRDGKINSKYL